ncbi:murein L,D-transpeptidase [Ancylobacter sp. 6x-1]|uniref:Murein L,D-transpeptidase n=1 Tax=Ancylobacter crimeensis TaxID=2579147 RepID=A0ABT0D8C2_9HYPH|nr:murein L,D-transpeptidase family protein [Ancylobacter crimeensis]MCK0196195.1 murein L,D-transpeptidase [Ancylobacter crimeensis]
MLSALTRSSRPTSTRLRTLLLLALAVTVAGCSRFDGDDRGEVPIPPKLMQQMSAKGMTPADPIMVRIYKKESELELWKRDRTGRYALLKTYPLCRWSGKLGPKMREGDRQAPEGFYTVTRAQMNPRSQYYLSFNLGYPNPLEQALGYEGGALMVHGACTSAGCYAMTNDGIGEIYPVAREALAAGQPGFQVEALPFRMTARNLALYRNDPNMPFWRNLKEGTDLFSVTRQPPQVAACQSRYRFTPAGADPGPPSDPLGPCPAVMPDVAVQQAIAAKQANDEAAIATLAQIEPPSAPGYVDGGMNASFREILRKSGPQKLAAMTSGQIPVSQPDAALADPYVPPAATGEAVASIDGQ